MVPKPAVCSSTTKKVWDQFLPTWSTFFATMTGLMSSVPVPLILITLFKKYPVMEVLTPEEKHFQIGIWRCKQTLGWILVLAIHGITVYWLMMFSNQYDWPVFGKWVNSGVQSLVHRFVTAPLLRGLVLLLILLLSKSSGCCDFMLVFFPHIIPTEELLRTAAKNTGEGPSQKGKDKLAEEQADQGVDMDLGDL